MNKNIFINHLRRVAGGRSGATPPVKRDSLGVTWRSSPATPSRYQITIGAVLILICVVVSISVQAEDLSVLPKREQGQKVTYLQDAFRPLIHAALDRRLKERDELKTPEQIETWQKKLRDQFIRSLGGFPEHTPLNANIVGTIEADDYRIEKVIY